MIPSLPTRLRYRGWTEDGIAALLGDWPLLSTSLGVHLLDAAADLTGEGVPPAQVRGWLPLLRDALDPSALTPAATAWCASRSATVDDLDLVRHYVTAAGGDHVLAALGFAASLHHVELKVSCDIGAGKAANSVHLLVALSRPDDYARITAA